MRFDLYNTAKSFFLLLLLARRHKALYDNPEEFGSLSSEAELVVVRTFTVSSVSPGR